ncbi:arsenite transporter, ACR3 family [Nannocystis exedens]|uniref:Arsenite transporter, ACR3 family n=1 Tax=Nannocystis exedens TaxID=54 RepID=A0A1I1XHD5_9BACT|nr:ACR3 family arsenite efflux transporter [Nannocystis exedens]PCC73411.1 arsenic transporter [Nannocystis exedens]SFE06702.1 arsenite transporter, ACR3 family [Nannocystis exedens]
MRTSNPLGIFERYLSLWVALAIAAGVALGNLAPGAFAFVSGLELASVNLVVAALIWVMIYPMMIQIDFGSLRDVGRRPRGLVVTLVTNWLIKPFTMAGLASLFFLHLFADLLPAAEAREYVAGAILLGVAPCTAMVFVWSQLTRGDANYTLVQVAVNDLVMVVAFAPLTALLLGVSDIAVPWTTLLLSVGLYVVVPLVAGAATRRALAGRTRDRAAIARFVAALKPVSVLGLLGTVVLLFGFQATTLVERPLTIALIAVPLLLQSYGIFALAYLWAWAWRLPHAVAAPAALIGTSNFFELAVAVAIGLFGLQSGAALATVVGVLVEVPVMLSLCALANRTAHRFPA